MGRSASRSGQNFCCEVRLGLNIQPMCAYRKPLVRACQSVPNRHGECGSPSRSLYLWWRRWSATQTSSGPSMARLPAMAIATRSGLFALNELCVKWRWKPMLIPKPEIT